MGTRSGPPNGVLRSGDRATVGPLPKRCSDSSPAWRAGTVRPRGRERYKPNTTRSYERALRVHIGPSSIAGIKVADLRRRDLQDFADELGAKLSVGTVSNVLNPIQAFYRRAIDRDELTYNPSERIDLPNGCASRPSLPVSGCV